MRAINRGDRVTIKFKRLGASFQPEDAYIWGTVMQVYSRSLTVKYDTPQNGDEYIAFSLPLPEHVRIVEQALTIRFEVYDGDIADQFPCPMPNVGIDEVVQARIDQGRWIISGKVGNASYCGTGDYKNGAILNYLSARLGMSEETKEEEPGD